MRPVRRRVGGRQLSAVLFLKLRHPQRFSALLPSQHAAVLLLLLLLVIVAVVLVVVVVVTQQSAVLDGVRATNQITGKVNWIVTSVD